MLHAITKLHMRAEARDPILQKAGFLAKFSRDEAIRGLNRPFRTEAG
jgi:hypothetical protein